ncbi:hypothetical protein CYLTODRAFT_483075, partial [Cylindrobasidium torrendii FP15055 ss-10]
MRIWDDPAVARRMDDLAAFVKKKPGTPEEKAARDSIMGVPILESDPRPPPYRKQDHYASAVITPEKAKAEGDRRMKGKKVLNAVLEMSIHVDGNNIVDSITHERLETYDVTHTRAFSSSAAL